MGNRTPVPCTTGHGQATLFDLGAERTPVEERQRAAAKRRHPSAGIEIPAVIVVAFEDWWPGYPNDLGSKRKGRKPAALAAFWKAIHLDAATLGELDGQLSHYVQARDMYAGVMREPAPLMHASTFLNDPEKRGRYTPEPDLAMLRYWPPARGRSWARVRLPQPEDNPVETAPHGARFRESSLADRAARFAR